MNQDPLAYTTQEIMNSDPVTLVAMLYDKAVHSLKASVWAIRDDQIETSQESNGQAIDVIRHLLMTLDMDRGGEIASNLEALYAYMLRRLTEVKTHNDTRAAEEVIELLEPLRYSWRQLATANNQPGEDTPEIDGIRLSA